MKYILALDQGTTSSRAIVFDQDGRAHGAVSQEFEQIYPQPGWVEHNPEAIWQTQIDSARQALLKTGVRASDVAAIGITNQRETTVVWDRKTGKPLCNAIVWQCRRTAEACEELKRAGRSDEIRRRSGLVVDAYFSGTKIAWILDQVPGARRRAEAGELAFGTVDTWLVWKLTGGRVHATDVSNASRTMLLNLETGQWDPWLCETLRVPAALLPAVLPSSGPIGETDASLLGQPIPITGIAGDQQAALFGQACFEVGMAKNTYGTGCFLLMQTGDKIVRSDNGLLTTIAWSTGQGLRYALEGSVFIAGAAIQWLRDGLQLIESADQTEALASSVPDNGGVYMVPAFVGLGAPYWDMYARGLLVGLTRGTTRAHIVRAALESIAHQTADVTALMEQESGTRLAELRVDGGASRNNLLCQMQADILGRPVRRAAVAETTALGAAFLAGLGAGVWKNESQLTRVWKADRVFESTRDDTFRGIERVHWKKAVARSRGWAG
ncbi:MAG: glycerol kinase GlpK [Acidobacteriota bacterium]